MPVYFAQAPDGAIKIGWTGNPRRRLSELRSRTGLPLKMIRLIEGALLQEVTLHERFAAERLHGEWFRFHPDMLTVGTELAVPEVLAGGRRRIGAQDVGQTPLLAFRMPPDLGALVDGFAKERSISRSEALRRILAEQLTAEGYSKP